MKLSLTLAIVLSNLICLSQDRLVKIECRNYTSYFDTVVKQPRVVVYSLYKGGGTCKRSGFFFRNDRTDIKTATLSDYSKSGFDRGHMANAEDFAFDCLLEELTFRYYNCIPQTMFLNRGVWRENEISIRELSQADTIRVICFARKFRKYGTLHVPSVCGKIVEKKDGTVIMWTFDQNGYLIKNSSAVRRKFLKYLK